MYSLSILEEELKNKVAHDYFRKFDCSQILGRVDFSVSKKINGENLFFLWAEAKAGNKKDIYESFVQLILTIGRERPFETNIPPLFLGAFDAEKIAFIRYDSVVEVFYFNDFNWNVSASDHKTKEFEKLHNIVKEDIEEYSLLFNFENEKEQLKDFIRDNFVQGNYSTNKIEITKNNFTTIYYHWLKEVQPTINIHWQLLKEKNIIDADFYLADLLSRDDESLKDTLFVLLKSNHYEFQPRVDDFGLISSSKAEFSDKKRAHNRFWNKYKRPPREEFWDYIIERRDLLVPQDLRERKGSFFTPQCWVELSQSYMADYFGEDWQDEYYIWDCAGGTGNLLYGLTNKYQIWVSTLDQADVDVMRDRIANGANLLEEHVFQFDFLNEEFDSKKIPTDLKEILTNPEERRKLVIYINPPYAEATSSKTISNEKNRHKADVAVSKTKNKYQDLLKQGAKELFIQFIFRVYKEIEGAYICNFSTIKALQGVHYREFRNVFQPKLEKLFIVPAFTFDNVNGKFPIGFFIYNTQTTSAFTEISADVYDEKCELIGQKKICVTPNKNIKDWLAEYKDSKEERIAYLVRGSSDVQNNNIVHITLSPSQGVLKASNASAITKNNLLENVIFLAVRKVIADTWLNDRDQYLYPKSSWQDDEEFITNCLTYALFTNVIKSSDGVNHWIPFTEEQVGAKGLFQSHFMTKYIAGKVETKYSQETLFNSDTNNKLFPLVFSQEAKGVFEAGMELWKYYHSQPGANVNASLYDIRERFQGRKPTGKMNITSDDEIYTRLIDNLREKLKVLADKIEPKVYEHGFLMK